MSVSCEYAVITPGAVENGYLISSTRVSESVDLGHENLHPYKLSGGVGEVGPGTTFRIILQSHTN